MAQPQRLLGHHIIKFLTGGTAMLLEQRLIASERLQPIAGRGAGRRLTQFQQQFLDVLGARKLHSGRGGGCLQKMQMGIDESGCDGAPAKPDQMGARSDQRLEVGIAPAGDDAAATDRNRIGVRMARNQTFVEHQVGLCFTHSVAVTGTSPVELKAIPRGSKNGSARFLRDRAGYVARKLCGTFRRKILI